jgi:hypothetical protein
MSTSKIEIKISEPQHSNHTSFCVVTEAGSLQSGDRETGAQGSDYSAGSDAQEAPG